MAMPFVPGAWCAPDMASSGRRPARARAAWARPGQRGRAPLPASLGSHPGRAASGEADVAVAGLPQEVLLERELHGMGLRSGDEHAVLAWREHLVGQDDHAVV